MLTSVETGKGLWHDDNNIEPHVCYRWYDSQGYLSVVFPLLYLPSLVLRFQIYICFKGYDDALLVYGQFICFLKYALCSLCVCLFLLSYLGAYILPPLFLLSSSLVSFFLSFLLCISHGHSHDHIHWYPICIRPVSVSRNLIARSRPYVLTYTTRVPYPPNSLISFAFLNQNNFPSFFLSFFLHDCAGYTFRSLVPSFFFFCDSHPLSFWYIMKIILACMLGQTHLFHLLVLSILFPSVFACMYVRIRLEARGLEGTCLGFGRVLLLPTFIMLLLSTPTYTPLDKEESSRRRLEWSEYRFLSLRKI